MKKLFFVLVIAVLFLSAIPAKAMETKTYTGSATSSVPYLLDFVTLRQGEAAANITWIPRKNVNYIFQMFHYTDPNNVYGSADPSYMCVFHNYDSPGQVLGNWTCNLLNAPVGYYRIYFRPYNGGAVSLSLSVIAETNP